MTPLGEKNHATSQDKKKLCILLGDKKITQPLGTKNDATSWHKNIAQPLGINKKNGISRDLTQPLRLKKSCTLSRQKNITQPLRTKNSRNLLGQKISRSLSGQKKSCNLSEQKSCNHSGKKSHFLQVQLRLNQSIRLQVAPNLSKFVQMGQNRLEQVQIDQNFSRRDLMGPNGTIRSSQVQMGSNGCMRVINRGLFVFLLFL